MIEPLYPVMLKLAGRPVVVVGGGPVAARKVESLVAVGARVTVIAPELVEELARRTDVEIRARPYVSGDLAGFWLAVVCTDDDTVQQRVFDDGEQHGVWMNAADEPDRCSFVTPAVARRGPVVVSVSTSGTSPALAQVLRDRMAATIPNHIAEVAAELARRRAEVKAAGRSTESVDWRPIVESLLEDG
jgi:siroheme synthase-like protein